MGVVKKAPKAADKLYSRGVLMTPKRFDELKVMHETPSKDKLEEVQEDAAAGPSGHEHSDDDDGQQEKPSYKMVVLNVPSDDTAHWVDNLLSSEVVGAAWREVPVVMAPADKKSKERKKQKQQDEKQFKNLKQYLRDHQPDVVLLQLHQRKNQVEGVADDQLADMEKAIIALCTLLALPLVTLAPTSALAQQAALCTANTWPVFVQPAQVCDYFKTELPRLLATRKAIEEDIKVKTEKYGKVEVATHFLKRASVALVPFGVLAVNFLGICRLVAKMMKKVGMMSDKTTRTAAQKEGSMVLAKGYMWETMGDAYQYALYATVLVDFAHEAQSAGMLAALSSISVADGFLLGSVSVVTGVISTWTAVKYRPQLVTEIVRVLTFLQLLCVQNPKLLRE
eukprot:jgi/Chlat1/235/Chrsp1S03136